MPRTSDDRTRLRIVRDPEHASIRVLRPRRLEDYLTRVHDLHLDPFEMTELHAAAERGDDAAVERLIEARLELAAVTALALRTPDVDPIDAVEAANEVLASHVRARRGRLAMWIFLSEVVRAIEAVGTRRVRLS